MALPFIRSGPSARSHPWTTLRPPHLTHWQGLLALNLEIDPEAVLAKSTALTLVQATLIPPKGAKWPLVATLAAVRVIF